MLSQTAPSIGGDPGSKVPRSHVLNGSRVSQIPFRNSTFEGMMLGFLQKHSNWSAAEAVGVTLNFPNENMLPLVMWPVAKSLRPLVITTIMIKIYTGMSRVNNQRPLNGRCCHVLTRIHTVLPVTRTFIHNWTERCCTLVCTYFPSCRGQEVESAYAVCYNYH